MEGIFLSILLNKHKLEKFEDLKSNDRFVSMPKKTKQNNATVVFSVSGDKPISVFNIAQVQSQSSLVTFLILISEVVTSTAPTVFVTLEKYLKVLQSKWGR